MASFFFELFTKRKKGFLDSVMKFRAKGWIRSELSPMNRVIFIMHGATCRCNFVSDEV